MLKRILAALWPSPPPAAEPEPKAADDTNHLSRAVMLARARAEGKDPYFFPIKAPDLMRGVVPEGTTAPIAMDAGAYDYAAMNYSGTGFPGYPYLGQLATRPEFRAFAAALSTELTREWIELTSSQDDDGSSEKLKAIDAELKRLGVRGVFQKAAQHDCYFGRAQIFVELKGHDRTLPLILSDKTVERGCLHRVVTVEPMWTTPSAYNAIDPAAPDFYRPTEWFMLGQKVHASRMLTVVTRELPDMLKPSFNFGGMSLSQLAEPYVDNWLRTRQSVSDLINNFSITALATSMDQVLSGADDGTDLFKRAELFTQGRSNKGLMLLDKEREELVQINTPLSGLHELQAQSQEQMCSVSRMPAIVLTGISPSGLNASSDGEIRIFYDWIAAQQESFWRSPLETIIKLIQLSLFGEIDDSIGFKFVPLYQMTPSEEAEIRAKDATTATAYIGAGVIDPSEERERLARDPNSGYEGLDLGVEIVPPSVPDPDDPDPDDEDEPPPGKPKLAGDDWEEGKHPRAKNGQFGKGGAGPAAPTPKSVAHVDEQGNARSGGLTKRESKIEGNFYRAVDKHADKLVERYHSRNGWMIDPDKVKLLDRDFAQDANLAGAVHEPSSKLAKIIYKQALDAKAAANDTTPTVFTAGGSGSGKSTTLPHALKQLGAKSADEGGLIYDSVLSSAKSAKSRIDQALAATKGDVAIAYTNADIEQAMMQNALRKRSVTIDTLMHAHVGASDTLRELAEHYKNNPRVKFNVMNNRGAIDEIAPGSIADVPHYERFTLRKRLIDVAQGMLDAGDIDRAKFEHLTR